MSDIQKARDVLAKWRKDPASRSAWERFDAAGLGEDIASGDRGYLGSFDDPVDVSLIVGTAGNPDLLDAIDGLLSRATEWQWLPSEVGHLATAILSADERMSA